MCSPGFLSLNPKSEPRRVSDLAQDLSVLCPRVTIYLLLALSASVIVSTPHGLKEEKL